MLVRQAAAAVGVVKRSKINLQEAGTYYGGLPRSLLHISLPRLIDVMLMLCTLYTVSQKHATLVFGEIWHMLTDCQNFHCCLERYERVLNFVIVLDIQTIHSSHCYCVFVNTLPILLGRFYDTIRFLGSTP